MAKICKSYETFCLWKFLFLKYWPTAIYIFILCIWQFLYDSSKKLNISTSRTICLTNNNPKLQISEHLAKKNLVIGHSLRTPIINCIQLLVDWREKYFNKQLYTLLVYIFAWFVVLLMLLEIFVRNEFSTTLVTTAHSV